MILEFVEPMFLYTYNVRFCIKFLKIDFIILLTFYVTSHNANSLSSSDCISCIISGGLCLIGGIDKKEVLVSTLLSEFSSTFNMDVCSFGVGHSVFTLLWLTIQGFLMLGSSLSGSGLDEYLFCTLLGSL